MAPGPRISGRLRGSAPRRAPSARGLPPGWGLRKRGEESAAAAAPRAANPSVRPAHRLLRSHPYKKTRRGRPRLTCLLYRENKEDRGDGGGTGDPGENAAFKFKRLILHAKTQGT